MTQHRDFEKALERRLRELLGPGYGVTLRGTPDTEVVISSPLRPDHEMSYRLDDYAQPEGYEFDVNDAAVLIYAHVGEREQRF